MPSCSIISIYYLTVRRDPAVRRILSLLLALLFIFPAALAEEAEDDSWVSEAVSKKRMPEHIEVVPYDELPEPREGMHHYLLLCIDQWRSRPRPAGIDPPTYPSGSRRDLYGNTDGIVILTLDTVSRRIMITSIVRDAAVLKPISTEGRQYYGRINYVYNDYGPEALCRLISEHLGIKIEKYILFNFSQIQDIIDLECLDGVYLELTRNEISYLARYAVPKHSVIEASGYFTAKGDPLNLHYVTRNNVPLDFTLDLSLFTSGKKGFAAKEATFTGTGGATVTFETKGACRVTLQDGTVEKGYYSYDNNRLAVMTGADVHLNSRAPAGLYHLKGHSALLYMRIRKSSNTDTDIKRTQRVRTTLQALADQCRSFTLEQANDLANSIMQHNDTTNMSLKDLTDAAAWAYELRDCTVEEFRVPRQNDVRSINFGNMAALEINWVSTRQKYLDFVDHTTLVRDFDFIVDPED